MSASELKPCPLCGGLAHILVGYDGTAFWPTCSNLDCALHMMYPTEEQAVAAWNNRSGKGEK